MTIPPFSTIRDLAEDRKGGPMAIKELLPSPLSPKKLASIPDDRWLSGMTKRVFQAGFNWPLIEKKWPGFEEAFEGFDPQRWMMMSPDDEDRLLADTRIVRNGAKIVAVRENARLISELTAEYGSTGAAFARWPQADFIGLLDRLKTRGSRLGGMTAQYFLRGMGVDGFVLSKDVTAALIRSGIIEKAASSKRDMKTVQTAFNAWATETGLPFSHISKLLAFSVDSNSDRIFTPL